MKSAQNFFIAKQSSRIDGVILVSKLCHQYEEKTLPFDGSHSGEFSRSGGYAGIAQAGKNFPERGFKYHRLVESEGLPGDPKPGR